MRLIVGTAVLVLHLALTAFAHKQRWDDRKEAWSSLMLAIYEGRTHLFRKMIRDKADVNYTAAIPNSGLRLTPLEVAVRMQNITATRALLKTGKVKNISSVLYVASAQSSLAIVSILVEYGANPADTMESSYCPLMAAASFGPPQVLEFLLRNGADPGQRRRVDGITPLMLAAHSGSVTKTRLLLQHGADKGAIDKNGKTALDYVGMIPELGNVNEIEKRTLMSLLR